MAHTDWTTVVVILVGTFIFRLHRKSGDIKGVGKGINKLRTAVRKGRRKE